MEARLSSPSTSSLYLQPRSPTLMENGAFSFPQPFSQGGPYDHSFDRGQQCAGCDSHLGLGQRISIAARVAIAVGPSL